MIKKIKRFFRILHCAITGKHQRMRHTTKKWYQEGIIVENQWYICKKCLRLDIDGCVHFGEQEKKYEEGFEALMNGPTNQEIEESKKDALKEAMKEIGKM